MEKQREEQMGRKVLDEYRSKKLHAKTNFEIENPQKIISDALAKDYRQMGENTRNQLARIMVLQPEGRKIKIGDEEMSVGSLEARIADSIETTYCGTSSQEEYHDWINIGQEVISDMNTDGVTPSELDTKNAFLGDLNQREVELMTCLGLYQRAMANDPRVQAKYESLYNKLQKLREIRSAVKNSTNNVADKVEDEKKKEEPQPVTPSKEDRMLMGVAIGALAAYDKLTDDDKKKNNMYHKDDLSHMDFHSHLSNYFLYNGDIRFNNKNVGEEKRYETSPLEANLLVKRSTQEDVAKHIEKLRGRLKSGQEDGFKGWKVDRQELQENKDVYQNHSVFKKQMFDRLVAQGR